ncbi:uncharacterized protein LOC131431187 [Malaya genurostris]|uniref:uncharacterized protein LOC131431187 n=1 Tax=Malaya genurostris TaxID=325434 RepID=UPI0026F3F9B5|nr:uncharacterized protein LOC131431187 [Malaya genurostris]
MKPEQPRANPKPYRNIRPQQPHQHQQVFIDLYDDGNVQVVSEVVRSRIGTEQTIIRNVYHAPLHPAAYDGTYDVAADESVSDGSFSTQSIESEVTETELSDTEEEAREQLIEEMYLESVDERSVYSVPIIELPEEQSSSVESGSRRRQSVSIVGNVRGHAVGAIIDPNSTVLMQMSRNGSSSGQQRVTDCIRNVNRLLQDKDSTVIFKYPDVYESQSSRRTQPDHRATTRQMMELTEDILRKVEGSSRESILVRLQNTLAEILNQPEDTIVVHTHSRDHLTNLETESEAFMGYFSKGTDTALFVQPTQNEEQPFGNRSGSDDDDDERMPMDRLRSFLQDSMRNQEQIMEQTLSTEPEITVSKFGPNIVGVLSYPNASAGVVTTTAENFSTSGDRQETTRLMKEYFKNLVKQPSEKLLVQIHSDEFRSVRVEQIKQELDQSIRSGNLDDNPSGISVRESEDKLIGVMSYSGGSIVIQTSSKNWIKKPTKDGTEELVMEIRLMIEKFILNNELSEADLKDIASIIAQVFHSEKLELPREYQEKPILEKVRTIVHQLMNRTSDENALALVNQIQDVLQSIAQYEVTTKKKYSTSELLRTYFDELICEEDTEFTEEAILIALREALLTVLVYYEASLSHVLADLLELLKTVPFESEDIHVSSCPGTTLLTDRQPPPIRHSTELDIQTREVIQQIHNLLDEDSKQEADVLPYVTLFQSLFLTLIKIIASWSVKIKSFINKESEVPVRSESSVVGQKPSVSFHLVQESNDETPSDITQQLQSERQRLNDTIDELRKFLENTLGVPESWHRERKGSMVKTSEETIAAKTRMMTLFSKLLEESSHLKTMENSGNVVHLRLESASGNLERRESDQFVMLSGSIRDQPNNLGLFFEARLVDLRKTSEMESQLECVKEVRPLSDTVDQQSSGSIRKVRSSLKGSKLDPLQSDSAKDVSTQVLDSMLSENVVPIEDDVEILERKQLLTPQDSSQPLDSNSLVRPKISNVGRSSRIPDPVEDTSQVVSSLQMTKADSSKDEFTSEAVNSRNTNVGGDGEDERQQIPVDDTLRETMSRYFEQIVHYIQQSVEPMRETMADIINKLATMELDKIREIRSSLMQTGSSLLRNYLIETPEASADVLEDELSIIEFEDKNIQCDSIDSARSYDVYDSALEQEAQFISIECELNTIKERLQVLDEIYRLLAGSMTVSSITSQDQQLPESRSEVLRPTVPSAPPLDEIEEVTIKRLPMKMSDPDEKEQLSSESITNREEFISAIQCPAEQRMTKLFSELYRKAHSEKSSTTKTADSTFVDSGKVLFASISTQTEDLFGIDPQEHLYSKSVPERSSSTLHPALPSILEEEELPQQSEEESVFKEVPIVPAHEVPVEVIPTQSLIVTDHSQPVDQMPQNLRQRISNVLQRYSISQSIETPERSPSTEPSPDLSISRKSLDRHDQEQPVISVNRFSISRVIEPLERLINDNQTDDRKISVPSEETWKQTNLTTPRASMSTTEASEARKPSILSKTTPEEPVFEKTSAVDSPKSSTILQDSARTDIQKRTSKSSMEASRDELPPDFRTSRKSFDQRDRTSSSSSSSAAQVRKRTLSFAGDPTEPHSKSRLSSFMLTESRDDYVPATTKRRSTTDPNFIDRRTEPSRIPSVRRESSFSIGSTQLSKKRLSRTKQAERKRLVEIPVRDDAVRRSLCDLALSYRLGRAHEDGKKSVCPVEVYSCHQVGPNQLMMHWEVLPRVLNLISGYEIYVDGELRIVCYSRTRRTALLANVKVNKEHRIVIYPTPDPSAGDFAQSWTPGVFIYHI